jgi:beta-xylosidase
MIRRSYLTSILAAFPTVALALINPILPGWNPDPSIIHVGDDYFIATSTFETFPGHPIWHSKNLTDWAVVGHALSRPSQLNNLGTASGGGKSRRNMTMSVGSVINDLHLQQFGHPRCVIMKAASI